MTHHMVAVTVATVCLLTKFYFFLLLIFNITVQDLLLKMNKITQQENQMEKKEEFCVEQKKGNTKQKITEQQVNIHPKLPKIKI